MGEGSLPGQSLVESWSFWTISGAPRTAYRCELIVTASAVTVPACSQGPAGRRLLLPSLVIIVSLGTGVPYTLATGLPPRVARQRRRGVRLHAHRGHGYSHDLLFAKARRRPRLLDKIVVILVC